MGSCGNRGIGYRTCVDRTDIPCRCPEWRRGESIRSARKDRRAEVAFDVRGLQLKTCPSCGLRDQQKGAERERKPRRDGNSGGVVRTGRSARCKPVASAFGPASPAGRFCRGATLRQSREVQGQAVLNAIVNDQAFVAGTANGEIGGAFGARGVFITRSRRGMKADEEPAAWRASWTSAGSTLRRDGVGAEGVEPEGENQSAVGSKDSRRGGGAAA